MNREWVENMKKENRKTYESLKPIFISKIVKEFPLFKEEDIESMLTFCMNKQYSSDMRSDFLFAFREKIFEIIEDEPENIAKDYKLKSFSYLMKNDEHRDFFNAFNDLRRTYEEYLDSEPMEFDGDIIITDPCYIMKEEKIDYSTCPSYRDYHKYEREKDYPDYVKGQGSKMYHEEEDKYDKDYKAWHEENKRDWDRCDCGFELEVFNIFHYMTRDTLYGDWSCTTYNSDTKEEIGEFCADAGLVSVILLDEVLKYNKDFDYHLNRSWTTTLIKDFKGTVQFVVKEERGTYDYDSEYWKKGDEWVDYAVKVVGHGINKVTGEPINFIGTQTGL